MSLVHSGPLRLVEKSLPPFGLIGFRPEGSHGQQTVIHGLQATESIGHLNGQNSLIKGGPEALDMMEGAKDPWNSEEASRPNLSEMAWERDYGNGARGHRR
ncbi:hypothetical protein O181_005897 [Austropuccinia psidii MF-1]|uniref:Uncharacterized protein n=1 Tax=Austropuccinia psidii MF-1 TaxID=1389203 RepID=A0A9Q3GH37_9BASI|nr:hypothetical protein [Austropuccinia psidii MF-1]